MALQPIPIDRGGSIVESGRKAAPPAHIAAGSVPFPGLVKYKALSAAVLRWLWRHRLPSRAAGAPRGFLAYGLPSTGKTKSICNILAVEAGLHVVTVPASSLGAVHETENVERLDAVLAGAVALSQVTATPVAIVVDDIDAVFNIDASVSRSQNTDYIRVWWQSLADRKHAFCNFDGTPIVVVFTSNAMMPHPAVFRDGRCLVHHHEVTAEERAAIVAHHLKPRTGWERRIVGRLARKHGDMPLAFFAEVASAVDDARLDALIASGSDVATIEQELSKPRALTVDLLRIARDLRAARAAAFNAETNGGRA